MQSAWNIYLKLGFEHILDLQGYDHILFITALCAIYTLAQWRQVAILVTAFTLGHSITLALAALKVVSLPGTWIEFLVPVTIVLTAVYNIGSARTAPAPTSRFHWNYPLAAVFGLIHGVAFSNFFRSSLFPGQEGELVRQLLAFNIGVELGQLIIVALILLVSFVAFNVLKIKQYHWNLLLSGSAGMLALWMAIDRWPL